VQEGPCPVFGLRKMENSSVANDANRAVLPQRNMGNIGIENADSDSVGNYYLLMALRVNLEGYTELVRYTTVCRAKMSFLQRHVHLTILLQGFINLF
jgi:hypothetical protein